MATRRNVDDCDFDPAPEVWTRLGIDQILELDDTPEQIEKQQADGATYSAVTHDPETGEPIGFRLM